MRAAIRPPATPALPPQALQPVTRLSLPTLGRHDASGDSADDAVQPGSQAQVRLLQLAQLRKDTNPQVKISF